nr:PAS domain-containing protein [Mariprofundus ferrooxydans]
MTDIAVEMETDSAVYKTLLESTKAIPWKLDWGTMSFSYIGPQIEALLGWAPSSWLSVEDWAARMHPDDRDNVVNYCVAQSQDGIDHEADYRALTKDGGYVWIRDVVHVIRKDDGEVEALVGFMFDISERKALEQSLERSNAELKKANDELQDAMQTINTISGIIPICAWCGHKIRNARDQWVSVESYLKEHTTAQLSHGMCPGCQEVVLNQTDVA